MKENSESINQILFSQFFSEVAGRIFQSQGSQFRLLLERLARQFFPTILASLIIGAIFFTCISLFLYQLAEYGL
jgi:hypothetical protein